MTVPVVLATPRLRLRELEPGDYDAVRALDADPEVQWWRGARRDLYLYAALAGERDVSSRTP